MPGVYVGWLCMTRAAEPSRRNAAMEVPLKVTELLPVAASAEVMYEPGAAMSGLV